MARPLRETLATFMARLTQKPDDRPLRTSIEIAPNKTDTWNFMASYLGTVPNYDPVLQIHGNKADAAYVYPYGLFDEAIDKDAHLYACLQQRKASLYGRTWRIVPAEKSKEGIYAAKFVKAALDAMSQKDGDAGITKDIGEFLDAVAYGMSIGECIWAESDLRVDGKTRNKALIIQSVMSRDLRRFTFTPDGELRLFTQQEPSNGIAVPDYSFILFRPYSRYEDFYGYPLLRVLWWLTWVKRQLMRWWMMHLERFGSPTLVANPTVNISNPDKAALLLSMKRIKQESALIMPVGCPLDFESVADAQTAYQLMINWINMEISKAVLGQTLTIEAGNTGGSRSLGEVQERVGAQIIARDARALEALMNGTVCKWLCELNLGQSYPCPKFVIDTNSDKNEATRITTFQQAFNMKIPFSIEAFANEMQIVLADENQPEDNIQEVAAAMMLEQMESQAALDPATQGNLDTRPQYDKAENTKTPQSATSSTSAKSQNKRASDRNASTGS